MYYEQEDAKWFESRTGNADVMTAMFEQVHALDPDVLLCMAETSLVAGTGANTRVSRLKNLLLFYTLRVP